MKQVKFDPITPRASSEEQQAPGSQTDRPRLTPRTLVRNLLSDESKIQNYFHKPLHVMTPSSHYDSEYYQKKVPYMKPLKNDIFGSFYQENKMYLDSTYRNEYFPKEPMKEMKSLQKPKKEYLQTPFSALSNYQETFFHKEGQKVNIIPQNYSTVMKNLEFIDKTAYNEHYRGGSLEKEKSFQFGGRSTFKNPLSVDVPFMHKSSSKETFKSPVKLKQTDNLKAIENHFSLPSFKGQFDSEYRQTYVRPNRYSKMKTEREDCRDASRRLLQIF